MPLLKDILQLDLSEDIKNVIDLEDQSENEIQSEIEHYILTDGLARHLADFINQYTSNIQETGVWISGFYGSGKSYFGKMLGHLLDNPMINGTPARERFIPRIRGVKNEAFLENDIRKLDVYETRVIFLDSAKQNTENGLAFTLFANFMKKLGLRQDLYGFMEYDLLLDEQLAEFSSEVEQNFGQPWIEVKRSNKNTAKAFRQAYMALGYSEKEFEDTRDTYKEDIRTFSAGRLRDLLKRYLEKYPDSYIVFMFDETSEALSQGKFNLLDLEGISESLSSLGSKVWTVAIAQEKLDDVINNASVTRSQLTKVTDRFKSKFHLESTEVDLIIRNRLLQKKDHFSQNLQQYFNQHEGQVTDLTNLKSSFPTKTERADQFAIYYPFHKYQFDLLQKFLFSSNQLAASQIAARGMIITTFDVLRKALRDEPLYHMATGHAICREAQTAPPTELGIKYDNAYRVIASKDLAIDGRALLQTIHFLSESELAPATLENITKSYIKDINDYYETKPGIDEALGYLVEAKILLPPANQVYKITSDLEGKLLEEMQDFSVELFVKKRELVNYISQTGLFRKVAVVSLDNMTYKFRVATGLGDEIEKGGDKSLELIVYNMYNMTGDRQDFVEEVKMNTQYDKGSLTLIPENTKFQEIDRLLSDVKKFSYMEERYANDEDASKRKIISEFVTIKEEKERELSRLIYAAYESSSLIYRFDEYLLNANTFKAEISEVQQKAIQNIYTKRLSAQLNDSIAIKILRERDASRLASLFSGVDFQFFDKNGNFVGEHLKVVEEIQNLISKSFQDGKSLEDTIGGVPWGYSYGTVVCTLAVMFRAGKLIVKYSGANSERKEYFSYQDSAVHDVFKNSLKFRSASFKAISRSLSVADKNQAVQALMDLEYEKHTEESIDWNTSDYHLAEAIKRLAERFLTILQERRKDVRGFEQLFSTATSGGAVLQDYTGKITEANYLDQVQRFLTGQQAFADAQEAILKASKFIRSNLSHLNSFDRFLHSISGELHKAGMSNEAIATAIEQYDTLKQKSIVNHFKDLSALAQSVKDAYFQLMVDAAQNMSVKYKSLLQEINQAREELNHYPAELNTRQSSELARLSKYVEDRIVDDIQLEYHISCQKCGYSLSDMVNYIALENQKRSDLLIITSSFVKRKPSPRQTPVGEKNTGPRPRKTHRIDLTIPSGKITLKEYRNLLASQLQAIAGLDNDDYAEINLDTDK